MQPGRTIRAMMQCSVVLRNRVSVELHANVDARGWASVKGVHPLEDGLPVGVWAEHCQVPAAFNSRHERLQKRHWTTTVDGFEAANVPERPYTARALDALHTPKHAAHEIRGRLVHVTTQDVRGFCVGARRPERDGGGSRCVDDNDIDTEFGAS